MLDGEDVLCCTATGDGKSAAFAVPILVLNEYNAHKDMYPAGFPSRTNPVGLVVTPTKGLASNIVLELTKLGVAAFAYSKESLADARRRGTKLADEIKTCTKWRVICVDPEHLKTKEWREIADFPEFRLQLIYAATDEAHLINEWGMDFRVDFKSIGLFVRGCLPPSICILALSATLAPGKDTTAFSIQTLSHGLSGYEFPDLLPYLCSGRKVIVNFHSLPMLFHCYAWIWRMQPDSADKKRRTRMYHSGCSAECNEETIRMILEDPLCQFILCTIAFSNGINARTLLDCITVGFHFTIDILWQQMGRVGRQEDTLARGILLIQPSTITLAEKYLKAIRCA
ncbi:P-loop containing nucleoside triphosphate hydrolase protein [Mycena sanguinolenta]|nr:P-loop containing nucleoside triphosphate hydrolase protein [Mycena sanguinolenta]